MKHRGRVVFRASLAFCGFVALFAVSRNEWLSGLMLVGTGYFMVLMIATVNVMLQHLSEDKMRGRVMSIYATAFLGFAPFGSLMAGSLAGTFTAPVSIAAMAIAAICHQQRDLPPQTGAGQDWNKRKTDASQRCFPAAQSAGHLRPGDADVAASGSMRRAAPFEFAGRCVPPNQWTLAGHMRTTPVVLAFRACFASASVYRRSARNRPSCVEALQCD